MAQLVDSNPLGAWDPLSTPTLLKDPSPSTPSTSALLPSLVTTPRLTRKRKAAEAAIADDDQFSPNAATKAAHSGNATATTVPATESDPSFHSQSKTGSKNACSVTVTSQDTERGSSTSSASVTVKKSRIATPATTTGSMDSDDDFMSDVSSAEDFIDTQGSEDESLGEGALCITEREPCLNFEDQTNQRSLKKDLTIY